MPSSRSRRGLSLRARRRAASIVGVVALAALSMLLVAWSDGVVVKVDGQDHPLRTYAQTVGEVIEQLDIAVGPHDAVRPPPSTLVSDGLEITVDRAITVEIVLDGEPETLTAPVTSVAGALEKAGIGIVRRLGADIVPAWTAPIEDGDTITVTTPTAVTLEVDGEVREVVTLVSSVENLLVRKGVELDEHDRVFPALEAPIEPGTEVVVERVDYEEVVEEVVLEHGEQRRETKDLRRGTTRVEDEGAPGLRLDTFRVTFVDGEEVDRELVDQEVVDEPRDRVVLIGTYVPPPPPPPTSSSTSGSSSGGDGVWDRLARCESGGNWRANTGNGFYGGLQFKLATWRSVGGTGYPHEHPREVQIEMGKRLQARAGWGQWPTCSRRLGLR